MSSNPQFVSILELFKGHVDALVTVSTGALVLSVTFLKDTASRIPSNLRFLRWSWALFTVSIVAGVLYSYALTHLASSNECWQKDKCTHRDILMASSVILHLSFFVAVLLFLIFALSNF